jgi:osmotically-inducible protein OsmY
MSSTTQVVIDERIRQSVERVLDGSAEVDGTAISVAVGHRVVTLAGEVADAVEQRVAERVAAGVVGVRDVVDHLVMRSSSLPWAITDAEIERRAADAITLHTTLPAVVRATALDHTVTLSGEVDWQVQRENARQAVEGIIGVTGVVNAITLRPRA